MLAADEYSAMQKKVWESINALRATLTPPSTLYHYTDAAGLKGIVESGKLRATHISFMNDASEYLHAVQLLLEGLSLARDGVSDPLQRKLIDEIEPAIAATEPQHVAPYFVACFSAKKNDLNQWRAYGRGEGGYSIGFDGALIEARMSALYAFLSPSIYEREQQAHLVRELISWALDEYPRVAKKYTAADQDKHRALWGHALLWTAASAAPIMKSPAFAEEEEWRIIHLLQSVADVRFFSRPTGLVPFVEMSLGIAQNAPPPDYTARLGRPLPDKLPITVLWSGPGRATDTSLLAGRALLEQCNYQDVKLFSSKISYRVG